MAAFAELVRTIWRQPTNDNRQPKTDRRNTRGSSGVPCALHRPPDVANCTGQPGQPGQPGAQGDSVAAFVEPVSAILAETKRRKPSAMRQWSRTITRQTLSEQRIVPAGYRSVCKPAWAPGGRAASSTSRDKGHRSRGTPSERGPQRTGHGRASGSVLRRARTPSEPGLRLAHRASGLSVARKPERLTPRGVRTDRRGAGRSDRGLPRSPQRNQGQPVFARVSSLA
jgi:hypothetical protein